MEENTTSKRFLLWGINHHTAPLSVREIWALNAAEKKEALGLLHEKIGSKVVILATCNRTEFYCYHSGDNPLPAIKDVVGKIKDKKVNTKTDYFFFREGEDAVRHLFKVASGINSQILGETEIQGQVKNDLLTAHDEGVCGNELGRLFEHALKSGKRIRTETRISEGVLSAGQAAVVLAQKILGKLGQARILLIGTGKIGKLTARALSTRGIKSLKVSSRTIENAQRLADEFKAEAVPFEDVLPAIAESDLVISSTGAPSTLFDKKKLEPLLRTRSQRPLVAVDLAVPRDFAPDTAEIDNVFLHDLDDLDAVLEQSREQRQNQLPRCEFIIDEEVNKFLEQITFRLEIEPLVKRLIESSEAWQKKEVSRETSDLSPESRKIVEKITNKLARKLLLFPVNRLKKLRNRGDLSSEAINLLKEIFDVRQDDNSGDNTR